VASAFALADVATLLELEPKAARGLVALAGVAGERFKFQDLVLLRAARDLAAAKVPRAHIRQSLRRLRETLPQGRTLASLRIVADGKRVVARDGGLAWEPLSGQSILDFQVRDLALRAAPFVRRAHAEASRSESHLGADDWFALALDLETASPDEARDAYRRTLEVSPLHAAAHVNLGRLLHEQGELAAAEQQYRAALHTETRGALAATAAFNLGVALEDQQRLDEAIVQYRDALALDPAIADAHWNLSGVLERQGKKALAFRHLKAYRELVG
jgi:tetratricopeptide (TPR) repeat protein